MSCNQAIVLLTHLVHPRIARHFERLKAECAGLLPAFLCLHRSRVDGDLPAFASGTPIDILVTDADCEPVMPRRCMQRQQSGRAINSGFVDVVTLTAMLQPALRAFDALWLMEYDVDYAGHWGEFFSQVMDSSADLLGTALVTRPQDPQWRHWSRFAAPTALPPAEQVHGFFPIARLSRRLLELYPAALNAGDWQGHYEALYPTIALQHGLRIEDLGGQGDYCPPRWRGKHYSNTPGDPYLTPGTFVFRPVTHTAYFHEAPGSFTTPGQLFHPVKVDVRPP